MCVVVVEIDSVFGCGPQIALHVANQLNSTIYPPEVAYPEASGGYVIDEKLSSTEWDRVLGSTGCRAVSEAAEGGRP